MTMHTGSFGDSVPDDDVSVFISRDGGLTWNQVRFKKVNLFVYECTYCMYVHVYQCMCTCACTYSA